MNGGIEILAEHITTLKGFAFKSSSYSEKGTPVVKVSDFTQDSVSPNKIAFIPTENESDFEKYKLKKGDVLIQTVGSWEHNPNSVVGKVVRIPEILNDSLLNQNIVKIIPKETIENSFLFYLLKNEAFKRYIINTAQGAANQASITLDSIKAFKFKYVDKTIQLKIASILSAYDDLIENNLKRIKLLEEAININYKSLIVKEDTESTNIQLNSIVDSISGFPFKSNHYNKNGKHKIVTIKNVQDGFFVPVVTDRIEDVPDKMNKELFLKTGDIIMSLTGNVGRVCLVFGENFVLNQRVIKLKLKSEIDCGFLYALLRDKKMQTILENLSSGVAQQNLSPIKMGALIIKYPSIILRKEFHKTVSPMISLICKLNEQNTKLREARDILLPRLMSGEIEV